MIDPKSKLRLQHKLLLKKLILKSIWNENKTFNLSSQGLDQTIYYSNLPSIGSLDDNEETKDTMF